MDELNKRIVEIMVKFNHSKSSLAQELGTSLPLITHITSGRNKPGIELLQKVLISFPEIDPYWLLLGNGNMIKAKPKPLDINPLLERLNTLESHVNQTLEVNQTALAYHKLLFDEIMHLKEISEQIEHASQNLQRVKQQSEQLKESLKQLNR